MCEYSTPGYVQGEDGKKFKTRAGTTVKLKDLLDEAVRIASEEACQADAAAAGTLSVRQGGKHFFVRVDDVEDRLENSAWSSLRPPRARL